MRISGEGEKFIIVLKKEDPLMKTLIAHLEELKPKGGMISGLGALKNVELGYYDLEKKSYIRKNFDDDDYELVHLSGNISLKEGRYFPHIHAVLGRRDFSTFGGHLFEATVAVTVELSIIPLGKTPKREMDSLIGLSLICGA